MKKRVGVITADDVLYNKIRLLLRECAVVTRTDADAHLDGFELIFSDVHSLTSRSASTVLIGEGGDLPYSFRHEALLEYLTDGGDARECLVLSKDGQTVHFGEASIKLTDQEYKLLAALLSGEGYVSKRELLTTVWGEGVDEGVVNVYVYYLRKKLERDGKRVIVSSRNEGYKIDEKYRRKD